MEGLQDLAVSAQYLLQVIGPFPWGLGQSWNSQPAGVGQQTLSIGSFLERGPREVWLLPLRLSPGKIYLGGVWGQYKAPDPKACLDMASASPLVKGLLICREEDPVILKRAPTLPACSLSPTLFLVFGAQLWNRVLPDAQSQPCPQPFQLSCQAELLHL